MKNGHILCQNWLSGHRKSRFSDGLGGAAVINAVASTVFGVYLIHDSFIGRPFIWDMLFEVSKRQYQSCWYPLMAAGTILIVFIVCIFVDMIRQGNTDLINRHKH